MRYARDRGLIKCSASFVTAAFPNVRECPPRELRSVVSRVRSGMPIAYPVAAFLTRQAMKPTGVIEAVQRLNSVFLEIPGTRLTLGDASRLSGLDRPICEFGLAALEEAGFLRLGRDGRYRRRMTDSPDS